MWSKSGFHLQHFGALFTRVETRLYIGEYREARADLIQHWDAMTASFILRWQMLNIMALFLRGRVSLGCWLDDRSNKALERDIEKCARKLSRLRSSWQKPPASILHAGLAVGKGNLPKGIELVQEAAKGFDEISLRAYAAACSFVEADLRGNKDSGAAKLASRFLSAQQVQKPEDAFWIGWQFSGGFGRLCQSGGLLANWSAGSG